MYLVTGCAGFIGFHMCNLLLKKNYEVVGIDSLNSYYSVNYKKHRISILKKNKKFIFYKLDLNQKKKIQKVFLNHQFYNVIHFAAQPGVIYSYKNPKSYYQNNFKATEVLIDQIKKTKSNILFFLLQAPFTEITKDIRLMKIFNLNLKIFMPRQKFLVRD